MTLLNNRKLLVSILAVLAVLRFVVVPIIDWQNTKASEIESLKSRLEKSKALVAQSDYLQSVKQQVDEQLNNQQQVFFHGDADSASQLKQLQNVEKLLKARELNLRSSRWLGKLDHDSYTELRLEINITGELIHFIQFISDLETQPLPRRFVEWRVNIKGMTETEMGRLTRGSAIIKILVSPTRQSGNTKEVDDV
ncbi:GspMb/PilO family protein [Agarivorans gilvus]|uniref:Uncharacterized protein n=1 Tax=Agarivorans gilvus TaxID=680279 RepID=A0ABQ1HYI0_9ALTE|nr:GspMb/PilO family protein [Agarivorans gilvus]GGA98903.1 hypothetical protein GCM10007414_09900 [Agarivorans gilvus]